MDIDEQSKRWVGTWTAMPQLTEPDNLPPPPFTQPELVFFNTTLRQTLQVTIGGKYLRLKFSNTFGDTSLTIDKVAIALPMNGDVGGSAIVPGTEKVLTFDGRQSVTIPAGTLMVSDPIEFEMQPLSNVAVTFYTAKGQQSNNITSHPGSRTTSYAVSGDHLSDIDIINATPIEHWYILSCIEVLAGKDASAVVLLGDSLTDGRSSTTNKNHRWPNLFSRRLIDNPATAMVAVLNQAAGGNRVLNDGLGPSAISRIDRDVLAQSGVRWLVVFEGVNDIGTAEEIIDAQNQVAECLIAAYEQIITRAHAKDIIVYGATLTPFGGSFYDDDNGYREATRQYVNHWIRTAGKFNGAIDFDAAVRNPELRNMLLPEYDSGDQLHLSPAGYKELADTVPLRLFC